MEPNSFEKWVASNWRNAGKNRGEVWRENLKAKGTGVTIRNEDHWGMGNCLVRLIGTLSLRAGAEGDVQNRVGQERKCSNDYCPFWIRHRLGKHRQYGAWKNSTVINEWDGSSCATKMVQGKEYNSAAPPLGNYATATGRSTTGPLTRIVIFKFLNLLSFCFVICKIQLKFPISQAGGEV